MATNKPVLIITPLAVAFQFIKEAEKFGIGDIMYSKDGKYNTKIVVCNYERLDKFNHDDFECVILDESSILKNFDGAIKSSITIINFYPLSFIINDNLNNYSLTPFLFGHRIYSAF